jgi:YHS domain-containing protein
LFGETPQQAPEVVVPATPAPTPTADEDLIILETPEPAEPSAAENGLSFNNPDDASVAPNESLDLDLSLSPDDASPTIQMPDAAQQVTQPAAQPEEFQEEPEEESFNPYTGLRLDQPKWNQPEQKQAEAAPIDEFQPVEDEQSLPPLPPQAANGSSGSQPQKTTAPVLLPPAQTERTADGDQLPSLPILITDAEPALMGYCPVTLRDARQLQKGQREFASDYEGRSYVFVSEEAKQKFHRSPEKYAPAAGGADVILFAQSGSTIQGSLNHSVWYQGRLYLFSSSETLESFATRPASHAVSR